MNTEDLINITCPITHQIFSEPVKLSDGYIYEKEAIIQWLQKNNTSPMTRILLKDKLVNLEINHEIKEKINNYLENNLINPNDIFKSCNLDLDESDSIIKYEEICDIFDSIIINYSHEYLLNFIINNHSNEYLMKNKIDEIERHGDLEKTYFDNNRLIHIISRYCSFNVIEYLIDKNVNLEVENDKGWRPIHFICRGVDLSVMDEVI
jgi:hypothetical protein